MAHCRRARFLTVLLATWPALAFAHGGGLNADGCHTNRKTGDYHCHGARRVAPPVNGFYAAPAVASPQSLRSATVYFPNCAAARAAGAAPVRYGDPGYARHLDRDGDGVGCE